MNNEELKIYKSYQGKIPWTPNHEAPLSPSLSMLVDRYENFLLDGFGTLYLRDALFAETKEFIQELRSANKNLRLVTNTASRSIERLAEDLQKKGIDIHKKEIISSGSLLSELVPHLPSAEVFHFGKDISLELLDQAGISASENPRHPIVIVSSFYDEAETNQRELEKAKTILRRPESILIIMNPDVCAPTHKGPKINVAGFYGNILAKNTHCQTLYLGKPFPLIYQKALQSLIPNKGATLMIGDTLGTDVLGANMAGINSALLLRGNTIEEEMREDFYQLGVRPHFLLKNLCIR